MRKWLPLVLVVAAAMTAAGLADAQRGGGGGGAGGGGGGGAGRPGGGGGGGGGGWSGGGGGGGGQWQGGGGQWHGGGGQWHGGGGGGWYGGGSYYRGWGGPGWWGGGWYGGWPAFGAGVAIGAATAGYWGGSWAYPYYPYDPAFYAPYAATTLYASPTVVYTNPAPVTYVQPEPAWRYYCRDPAGFFPDIQSCPTAWLKVLPDPNSAPSPANGGGR